MMKDVAGVVAIDDGGSSTVCVTKNGIEVFPSVKGIYGNRTLTQVTDKHDFIVQYKNETYVAGKIAQYDCEYPLQMFSKSKQHDFFDLSVLIAVHQYGYATNKIVVSVPVKMHTEEEKSQRIKRLLGSHTLIINGISKTFLISDVKVTAESTTAYWISQPKGETHYLDIGSRTVNFSKVININGQSRMIDVSSGTIFDKGLEALSDGFNPVALADYICGQLLAKWNPTAKVYLLGGGALNEELTSRIKTYFINSEVMENTVTATAEGMYKLGEIAYGEN